MNKLVPIDSAPKDGTRIDITPDRPPSLAFWSAKHKAWCHDWYGGLIKIYPQPTEWRPPHEP